MTLSLSGEFRLMERLALALSENAKFQLFFHASLERKFVN
jgi:hypothetical protein